MPCAEAEIEMYVFKEFNRRHAEHIRESLFFYCAVLVVCVAVDTLSATVVTDLRSRAVVLLLLLIAAHLVRIVQLASYDLSKFTSLQCGLIIIMCIVATLLYLMSFVSTRFPQRAGFFSLATFMTIHTDFAIALVLKRVR